MQKFILILVFSFMVGLVCAQTSGTISYKETIKLDIQTDDMPEMPGVDLKSMFPESLSAQKELVFNASESLYQTTNQEEPEDIEMESDDGSMQIKFKMGEDTPEIIYTNLGEKSIRHQQGFMGRTFLIAGDQIPFKWKVTNEKVRFLDYECIKATTEDPEGKSVVAWFTPQIPVQVGPDLFGGLPGAILMLSIDDGQQEIMASAVNLGELEEAIKAPKEGKKVSAEEFDKIVEEKEKEIEEMGGNRIMIRN